MHCAQSGVLQYGVHLVCNGGVTFGHGINGATLHGSGATGYGGHHHYAGFATSLQHWMGCLQAQHCYEEHNPSCSSSDWQSTGRSL